MAKYWVSGSNTAAVTPATASSRVLVMGSAVSSGKSFWLRSLWLRQLNATLGPLDILDASSGATATGCLLRIDLVTATGVTIPFTVFNFNEPGIRFGTGVACFMDASGSMAIGDVGAAGYEV